MLMVRSVVLADRRFGDTGTLRIDLYALQAKSIPLVKRLWPAVLGITDGKPIAIPVGIEQIRTLELNSFPSLSLRGQAGYPGGELFVCSHRLNTDQFASVSSCLPQVKTFDRLPSGFVRENNRAVFAVLGTFEDSTKLSARVIHNPSASTHAFSPKSGGLANRPEA